MLKFQKFEQIYLGESSLSGFKSTFASLAALNQILHRHVPENLAPLCHVGAIDSAKSIIVVFVTQPQVLHILKGMSDQLLHAFYAANYPFDKIMLKVSITTAAAKIVKRPALSPQARIKLGELAIAIGKPEIIIDDPEDETLAEDEIKL